MHHILAGILAALSLVIGLLLLARVGRPTPLTVQLDRRIRRRG